MDVVIVHSSALAFTIVPEPVMSKFGAVAVLNRTVAPALILSEVTALKSVHVSSAFAGTSTSPRHEMLAKSACAAQTATIREKCLCIDLVIVVFLVKAKTPPPVAQDIPR